MITTTEDEPVSDGAIPLTKREEPLELYPGAIRLFTTEELKWLFPHQTFLDDLNRTATQKSLREFVLLTHIYCEYYLNALVKIYPYWRYISDLPIAEKCWSALIKAHDRSFGYKLHLIGVFLGADARGASLIDNLEILNKNRNAMAHQPFVKRIAIKGKQCRVDDVGAFADDDLKSIKEFHVNLLNTMYTEYIAPSFKHLPIKADFQFKVFQVGDAVVEDGDFKKLRIKLVTAKSLGLGDSDERYIYFDKTDASFEKIPNELMKQLKELTGDDAAKIGRRCLVMKLFPELVSHRSSAEPYKDITV